MDTHQHHIYGRFLPDVSLCTRRTFRVQRRSLRQFEHVGTNRQRGPVHACKEIPPDGTDCPFPLEHALHTLRFYIFHRQLYGSDGGGDTQTPSVSSGQNWSIFRAAGGVKIPSTLSFLKCNVISALIGSSVGLFYLDIPFSSHVFYPFLLSWRQVSTTCNNSVWRTGSKERGRWLNGLVGNLTAGKQSRGRKREKKHGTAAQGKM